MSPRLQTTLRTFLGLGLGVLSVYLFFANLSFFLNVLGLFDIEHLQVTDRATVAVAVAAGLAGAVWISLRPAGRVRVEHVEDVAETLVRYSLGFILPIYGATKLLNVQFRLPFVALDTPLGEASGYALVWRFSGYSYAYECAIGLGELVGAGLLFFRRTTTLGACILLGLLANIAFLNYSHGIPVKFYATCYVLMACYLLSFDFPRLSALFLENKAFGPRSIRERPLPPQVRTALGWLKAGYILFAFAHAFLFILVADSRPTAVSGAWVVTQAQWSGGSGDGPSPPALPWRKVFFEREMQGVSAGSVKEADGSKPKRFRYQVAPEEQSLAITFHDAASGPPFTGSYLFVDDRTLKLTGDLGGRRVEIVLSRLFRRN